uniref:Photoreceptor outer segment membrane glycoprotein 2-like n=1 Tax=Gouania willdenowi TaxID=441366 RepID=A0A8C5GZT0_GOUWI
QSVMVGRLTFTKAEREKLAEVLWLLNWISVVSGLVLVVLGLFLRVEVQRWVELMEEQAILYVPPMLISTGLAACVINFLGVRLSLDCTDLNRFLRWKLLLLPYVCSTFCFTSCILVGALTCFSIHSTLEDSLFVGLRDAMRSYKDTDTPGRCLMKKNLDLLQLHMHCCGNTDHRDWTRIQWVSTRYLDLSSRAVRERLRSNVAGQYLMDGAPFSCCSPLSPWPCIQNQLTNRLVHLGFDRVGQQQNLWSRGCRLALMEHYTGLLRSTGLTVLLVWVFEVPVLTCVLVLTAMENLLLLGDPESESDGWILENSLAQTARSNLGIIKNLGKCYQVEVDPNINTVEPQGFRTTSGPQA